MKENNSCDLLFAFLDNEDLPKLRLVLMKKKVSHCGGKFLLIKAIQLKGDGFFCKSYLFLGRVR